MQHKEKRMAGRYVPAFSWGGTIDAFLRENIAEAPLLHVCSGPVSDFGDVRLDRYVAPIPPGVIGDWTSLPFASDSFAAVFADPPWNLAYMQACADFCHEALRVAPVAYVMSPWLWVHEKARRSKLWIRDFPGVNQPIIFARYERVAPQAMLGFHGGVSRKPKKSAPIPPINPVTGGEAPYGNGIIQTNRDGGGL